MWVYLMVQKSHKKWYSANKESDFYYYLFMLLLKIGTRPSALAYQFPAWTRIQIENLSEVQALQVGHNTAESSTREVRWPRLVHSGSASKTNRRRRGRPRALVWISFYSGKMIFEFFFDEIQFGTYWWPFGISGRVLGLGSFSDFFVLSCSLRIFSLELFDRTRFVSFYYY